MEFHNPSFTKETRDHGPKKWNRIECHSWGGIAKPKPCFFKWMAGWPKICHKFALYLAWNFLAGWITAMSCNCTFSALSTCINFIPDYERGNWRLWFHDDIRNLEISSPNQQKVAAHTIPYVSFALDTANSTQWFRVGSVDLSITITVIL